MQQFTGLEYIKIDLANRFGLDKLTWNERIDWAEWLLKDSDRINDHIEKAEEPNLFLKSLYAHDDALAGRATGYLSSLDATASGIQIMACLSGCEKSAKQVNLIYTGKREDAYTNVNDALNAKLTSNIEIPRSKSKYALMTHYYNSTAKPKELFGEDTPELAAFYSTASELFTGCEEIRTDIQSCWRGDVDAHSWTLPDGHVAYVRVGDYIDKTIELNELKNLNGNHATFTHRAKVFKPNEYGISLPANVIHSIDGWLVRELRNRCKADGFDILGVHDSFWCHPNNMNKLRQHYLDILTYIASGNLLQKILSEILGEQIIYRKVGFTLPSKMKDAEYALS